MCKCSVSHPCTSAYLKHVLPSHNLYVICIVRVKSSETTWRINVYIVTFRKQRGLCRGKGAGKVKYLWKVEDGHEIRVVD